MTNLDQRASGTTRPALILLAVLAAGFLFRFLPLLIWPSISHPDEMFQTLEQGHRLAYGYGLVPWEFDYGARSWLLAYMAAGAMNASNIFGGGPQIYLPLIAGLLSALGAVSTLCTFLWGRRFFGIAGGIGAALVSASWIDNMYFGGRSLTEVVAAHFFVIAIYLAEPGYRVQSRGRFFAAGMFAGAAVIFRIHLAPVIGLLWIWRGLDGRRFLFLSLGAVLIAAFNGAFDTFTWHYPFEPIWQNIRFNLLQHGSDYFGTEPWWKYFYWMGANWGGTIAIFFPLVFLGGRRLPFLLVSAFAIVFVHSFIGHKEYRFVYPALLLFSIVMGVGAVDAARLLTHGWRDRMANPARPAIVAALAASWVLLTFVNYIGRDYEKHWDRAHTATEAALYVSRMSGVCGIGLNRVGNYETGGYTYFHKRVPLYWHNTQSWKVMDKAQAFNVMLYDSQDATPRALLPKSSPYRALACFKSICVMRRPGGCHKLPLAKPAIGKMGVDAVDDYPYVAGVD
jgi:hypothetical protein